MARVGGRGQGVAWATAAAALGAGSSDVQSVAEADVAEHVAARSAFGVIQGTEADAAQEDLGVYSCEQIHLLSFP